VPKSAWEKLKRSHFKATNYRCEICGGYGPDHPVELHEVWQYEPFSLIQRLTGLVVLCPACHEVKHIGLAMVNGWSENDAQEYTQVALELWAARSQKEWTLDLSLLERFGIEIQRKAS
jgi:hypothetical protein